MASLRTAALLAALVLVLGGVVARAQSISNAAGLQFGQLVASASAGTVVLAPNGTATASGGVILGNAAGRAAASFTVTGNANATYAITLPSTSVTLASGTDSMTLDSFTSNPSGTGMLSSGGSQALTVGATLHLGANQPAGSYSGSFSVVVVYN